MQYAQTFFSITHDAPTGRPDQINSNLIKTDIAFCRYESLVPTHFHLYLRNTSTAMSKEIR
ncbi:MAG: hypothetical protein CMH52_09150 [Myxococcales bacterium]|nr:hypothetical protein [Myxococcales bacterium]